MQIGRCRYQLYKWYGFAHLSCEERVIISFPFWILPATDNFIMPFQYKTICIIFSTFRNNEAKSTQVIQRFFSTIWYIFRGFHNFALSESFTQRTLRERLVPVYSTRAQSLLLTLLSPCPKLPLCTPPRRNRRTNLNSKWRYSIVS